ncbi:hypothetical protein AtNW77_Chr2g0263991 [Arabidopsis thaliana]|jgi:hypothetical protein|uniref:At2g41780 n=4 Tax=Arabidopsis TaxID=3701 RepID=O22942_ARATH|nr:uncharacterized protein AT2G41780 [Arabidopsis thaliana]NP_181709.1 uncharacterized protein AT2G41780 [Arabidopsis thaliana]KAG7639366.1 hypothetical protein ISN45_At02g036940 [Arabidopsis thaliana x Arabidopsis arenosa]KAG7643951.1 hypothetical protein ISN44_As02g037050 [Arabidopsis suecica]AAC02773.1 hypothetical protein [Arabidopsis thaliana]AAO23643.1 At2g41780 [Arabidopsis thaliana]AEC10031.1 hypothetical protein AT2G41780 [Arabidopsis thaliana]|eukprot:NP_001078038.1 hypothetical protein AT2G41780 [Arabidopsis thaliana]
MDDKTAGGKIVMNKEQLLLFMENRRKQEDHRLALAKEATRSEMVDRKASGKIIMNHDQQLMFNEDHRLAVKKASRSEMVDLEGMGSEASVIMSNVPQPTSFSEDHKLAIKNIISKIVKEIRDRDHPA